MRPPHKLLGSSVDPTKWSMMIKGAVPMIMFLVAAFHLDITEGMVEEYTSAVGAAVTACIVLYGLSRKIYLKLKK